MLEEFKPNLFHGFRLPDVINGLFVSAQNRAALCNLRACEGDVDDGGLAVVLNFELCVDVIFVCEVAVLVEDVLNSRKNILVAQVLSLSI